MTTFDLILHVLLVLTAVCPRVQLEVSSFNRSRDIRGCQNCKCGSCVPHTTPFELLLHFSLELTLICLCAKFDMVTDGSEF